MSFLPKHDVRCGGFHFGSIMMPVEAPEIATGVLEQPDTSWHKPRLVDSSPKSAASISGYRMPSILGEVTMFDAVHLRFPIVNWWCFGC